MNWKSIFQPFINFLLKYLVERFIQLSAANGKPGLQIDDFKILVQEIVQANKSYGNASGLTKAKLVGQWAIGEFGPRVDEYVMPVLVSKAYEWADKKGMLKP